MNGFSLIPEILCGEKNAKSKLCGQVESMREQLSLVPRLEKKLKEQEKLLSSTSDTIITLSRALRQFHATKDSQVQCLFQRLIECSIIIIGVTFHIALFHLVTE